MKKWSITAAALAILISAGQVLAADFPAPPLTPPLPTLYNWTGFYVGVNGGWGDGISKWTNDCITCQVIPTLGGTSGDFPVSGYVAGGTVGANYQIGSYVFGIEGDFDWSDLTGNSGSTCGSLSAVLPTPTGCETENVWLATLRGRVGYAFNNILLYGTAGAALGRIQTGLIPPSTFDSSVEAGWAVGAGLEVAFAPNWTARAEYIFVDLPNATCTTTTNCGAVAGSTVTFNENMLRAGINFKFGAW
jgi:outer membrane immunogenic protein